LKKVKRLYEKSGYNGGTELANIVFDDAIFSIRVVFGKSIVIVLGENENYK